MGSLRILAEVITGAWFPLALTGLPGPPGDDPPVQETAKPKAERPRMRENIRWPPERSIGT
jgi:hypothetical protein